MEVSDCSYARIVSYRMTVESVVCYNTITECTLT